MILMVAVLYTAVGSSPSQQAAALYTLKGAIDPGNQLSDWTSGAASHIVTVTPSGSKLQLLPVLLGPDTVGQTLVATSRIMHLVCKSLAVPVPIRAVPATATTKLSYHKGSFAIASLTDIRIGCGDLFCQRSCCNLSRSICMPVVLIAFLGENTIPLPLTLHLTASRI